MMRFLSGFALGAGLTLGGTFLVGWAGEPVDPWYWTAACVDTGGTGRAQR